MPECECAESWTCDAPYNTEHQGCPAAACDGPDSDTWCQVKESPCKEEELSTSGEPEWWFYCGKIVQDF